MEELPTELNIITLNCWGLLHLSSYRAERLAAIGRQLAESEPAPHIVALQECWTQEDYHAIRRETRFILPFGKFYHSGAFGSGLVILSKWPIEESTMFQYPLNGRPTAFFRGDWYVGKGVACAKIRYGPGEKDIVEVFNTHTHAAYEPADSYTVHRLAQCWEMAKLIRGASDRGHLAVALGDFNDVPLSLPYRLLTAHAPIRDAWRVLNPDSALGSAEHELERARRRPVPSAAFNIVENGATSNSAYNTWAWPKSQQRAARRLQHIPPDTPDPRGKRIDYIFFSQGTSATSSWTSSEPREINEPAAACADPHADGTGGPNNTGWVVKEMRVGMQERHPQLGCSLSDHFSVEATLRLHTASSSNSPPSSSRRQRTTATTGTHTTTSKRGSAHSLRPSLADTGADDPGRDAALEQGTYLQSPTGSEIFRQASREQHAASEYDVQLRDGSSHVYCEGLPCATYDEILSLVRGYAARSRRQRSWRLAHFFLWVGIAVACYVAVWFVSARGGAFALLVFASLGLVAGTLDGLVALLFCGAEARALEEFQWELMNAKATASGAGGLLGVEEEEKNW
ncbi:Endonuclease/exonuclease/phosphatase [Whalleya microplaca]|nr:Endonuclease/exonuclease/phosphatase [Whalleya microplaca]